MGDDHSAEGMSNLGMIFGMAAFLGVLLIVAIVVSVTLPSATSTTTTTVPSTVAARQGSNLANSSASTTTTKATGTSGVGSAAAVAACQEDVSDVQTALAAYQAATGSYPTPPAPWTALSYPTDFDPLTNAPPPGPYLKMPPGDTHYVVMWDSTGRIWVEPPGTFTPTYDAANDGAIHSTCTRVAH